MFKLGHQVAQQWVEHSYPPLYSVQPTSTGVERVLAAAPGGDPVVFSTLASVLRPPFLLLYVLHTPRGEGEPGRYQSPELQRPELDGFLDRFGPFLRADARFDLWLHSPTDEGTIVWDRHNMLYGYGPNTAFTGTLRRLGFGTGTLSIPVPHQHNYHPAFDAEALAVLQSMEWTFTPLRPEDEQ